MPHTTRAALESLNDVMHFDLAEIEALSSLVREIDVAAGTVLMVEGAPGDGCYLVVEGTAQVRRDGAALTELGRGEFIGELTWLLRMPRTATVLAATDMRLLVADSEAAASLLRRSGVLRYVATRLAGRVREGLSIS